MIDQNQIKSKPEVNKSKMIGIRGGSISRFANIDTISIAVTKYKYRRYRYRYSIVEIPFY